MTKKEDIKENMDTDKNLLKLFSSKGYFCKTKVNITRLLP